MKVAYSAGVLSLACIAQLRLPSVQAKSQESQQPKGWTPTCWTPTASIPPGK